MTRMSSGIALLGFLLLLLSFAPGVSGTTTGHTAQETAPISQAELVATGRALFMAKGCAICHRHDGAGEETGVVGAGPDLTHYAPERSFVRTWLKDPQAVRPQTMMPNLALDDDEIEALIAFLAAP